MGFHHPLGDYAPLVALGAIALGFIVGAGAPRWSYLIIPVIAELYPLIGLLSARHNPKADKQRLKEEDCSMLARQAFNACARASEKTTTDQKSWQVPANKEVRQAIFSPDAVDLPERFEILQVAWNAFWKYVPTEYRNLSLSNGGISAIILPI